MVCCANISGEIMSEENKTDKDKFIELMDSFGVGYKKYTGDGFDFTEKDGKTYVKFKEGYDKVVGYGQFYCQFIFDSDSKFIEIGIYE